MIELLGRDDAESAINALIGKSRHVRIAVAYWGKNSVKRLLGKLKTTSDVKVVCDLMSGSCNVAEVSALQARVGQPNVYKRNDLHAKVWITERGAVLGSSNASTNGIGREGSASNGLIEANVFVDDPQLLQRLHDWFDTDVMVGASVIKREDLLKAELRSITSPPPAVTPGKTLLEELRLNPDRYEGAKVVVQVFDFGKMTSAQEERLEDARTERKQQSLLCWIWDDSPVLEPSTIVLDFDFVGGRASIDKSVSRVLAYNELVKDKDGTKLLLCQPVNARTMFGGPLGEKADWERAATKAGRTGRQKWQIVDFARKFL